MPKNINKQRILMRSKEVVALIDRMNLSLSEFAKKCKITSSSFGIHLANRQEFLPTSRRRIMKQLRKEFPDLKWEDIFYFEIPLES